MRWLFIRIDTFVDMLSIISNRQQGQIVVVTRKTGATTGATRDKKVTVFIFIALPIALAYAVALVCFGNYKIVCLIYQRDVARFIARDVALVCFALKAQKHQCERERDYARDKGRDDRRENCMTVHKPTRWPAHCLSRSRTSSRWYDQIVCFKNQRDFTRDVAFYAYVLSLSVKFTLCSYKTVWFVSCHTGFRMGNPGKWRHYTTISNWNRESASHFSLFFHVDV